MTKLTLNEGAETAAEPAAPKLQVVVPDALDRKLTVKKIGALERMQISKIAGAENAKNEVYFGYLALAYSVLAVDGEPTVRRTEREVEALVGLLGDEGLEAVGQAHVEHFGAAPEIDKDALKN